MAKIVAMAIALLAAVAGCTVPRPPGDGPLRYRHPVFSSATVSTNITYGSAPDNSGNPVALQLDLYRPAGDTVARRPVVVWVHGGGFAAGDKASGRNFATYFARRGYIAASINYRLLAPPGCGGNPDPTPECVRAAEAAQHDAQAAVRWLRANAAFLGVDASRIAMAGSSAGAITSLLTGWRPEDPGTSGNPGPSSAIRAAVSIAGGTPTNEYITAGDAPAIFFHGTQDRTVFYAWAVSNAGAMYNLRIPVVLQSFQGAGHGLVEQGFGDVIYEQASYFLYGMLDLARAEGQPAAAARAVAPYERRLRAAYPEFAR
jgi:predicted esterase